MGRVLEQEHERGNAMLLEVMRGYLWETPSCSTYLVSILLHEIQCQNSMLVASDERAEKLHT